MARLSGNDVSVHQGDIDYDVFKKNTHFVICKATEGTGFTDQKFFRNRDEARRVGIPLGFYHFARPDRGNTPEAEADWFLSVVGTPKDGEMLVLDYEATWNGSIVDWCLRFLNRISSRLNGYKALIYLNESLTNSLDWSPVVSAGHGLWLAKYANPLSPDASFVSGKWPFAAMYQWTSSQTVPGISGRVDGNVFFGDLKALKAYGFHLPSEQPTPGTDMVTIKRSEYESMQKKISDLSVANQSLTDQMALKDRECQDAMEALKKSIRSKLVDLTVSIE